MARRGPSKVALTKALCSALAAGASLEQALRVAKAASPTHADALERAAEEVGNDAFRKDVLARLELEPPIAGAVLGKVRREYLIRTARIALDAMRVEEAPPAQDGTLPEIHLLAASVVSILVALWACVSGVLVDRTGGQLALVAALGALAASVFALLERWPIGSRFQLLRVIAFPPMLFFDLEKIIERAHRPLLDARRVLAWLAAGEIAGLVPGAVIAQLLLDTRSLRERRLLRALEKELRGAADARRASELWMTKARMPEALIKVAQHPLEEETIAQGTQRLARMVALLPRRARAELVFHYLAVALLGIAVYAIASSILLAIARAGVVE